MELMRHKKQALNCYALVLLACVITGCKATAMPNSLDHPYNADFLHALKKAKANSLHDELSSFVHVGPKISLKGPQTINVFRVAQTDKSIAVLDGTTMTVSLFGKNGDPMGFLGGRGREPGQYLSPTDIITTRNAFAVVDFTNHRVTNYANDGKLSGSFIYTAQAFSASRLLYNSDDDSYVLFGNRWKPVFVSGQQTADLVHIYKSDGSFESSSFQLPDKWLPLGLAMDDAPITSSDERGAAYFMLPFEYTIYKTGSNGAAIPVLTVHPPGFRSPTEALHLENHDLAYVHSWELKWTPIRALVVVDGYALVEYESFAGLRFTVDAWRLSTGQLTGSYQTNYLIVSHPLRGQIVLANNPLIGKKENDDLVLGSLLF
jgi:hypothetical protein